MKIGMSKICYLITTKQNIGGFFCRGSMSSNMTERKVNVLAFQNNAVKKYKKSHLSERDNNNYGTDGASSYLQYSSTAQPKLEPFLSHGLGQTKNKKISQFEEIPGPKPLPVIGNTLLFSSFGKYGLEDYWQTCHKLFKTYGNIVRISRASPKLDIIYLFRPEDLRNLFKNEGPLPYRPKLDILSYYRQQRADLFPSGGLVTENGEEWKRLRKAIPLLLDRKTIASYQERQANVTDELVTAIATWSAKGEKKLAQTEEYYIADVLPLLFRYTLEAVGVVSLGTRLGCLQEPDISSGRSSKSRAARIIAANETTLDAIYKSLFFPPFYRFVSTPNYRRLARAQDFLSSVTEEEFVRLRREFSLNPASFGARNPIIESLLRNESLSLKDVFLLLVEILQGGIDATATTLCFCIYFLACHEGVQNALFHEIAHIDSATHNLQGLPLLKAVLRETFRLRPSATSVGRVLQKDTIFSGFHVPAGTLIQGPPLIACRDPQTFEEPNVFNPFRWIKGKPDSDNIATSSTPQSSTESGPHDNHSASKGKETTMEVHPYAMLPFGHGARMCPGRRLAEQEIYLALIKLVQTYKIKLDEEKNQVNVDSVAKGHSLDEYVGQVMRLNMMPAKRIPLLFIRRRNEPRLF